MIAFAFHVIKANHGDRASSSKTLWGRGLYQMFVAEKHGAMIHTYGIKQIHYKKHVSKNYWRDFQARSFDRGRCRVPCASL